MEKVELERKCWTRLRRSWTLSRTEVWGHWLPEILAAPLALYKASSIEALLWVPHRQLQTKLTCFQSFPPVRPTLYSNCYWQNAYTRKSIWKKVKIFNYSFSLSLSPSPILFHPDTHTTPSVGAWTQSMLDKCPATELEPSSKWSQCAPFTWSKAFTTPRLILRTVGILWVNVLEWYRRAIGKIL